MILIYQEKPTVYTAISLRLGEHLERFGIRMKAKFLKERRQIYPAILLPLSGQSCPYPNWVNQDIQRRITA
jgi:hypothetical protein